MNKEKIFSWLDKLMDLVMLSLLILLFSLPIITIMASFSAGIHVFHQKRPGAALDNLFQLFFTSFKASFLKGLMGQLVICFFYYIGFVNIEIAQMTTGPIRMMIYSMTLFFLTIITLSVINFMFVMTNTQQPVKQMLRKSIIMTFVKFPTCFLVGFCYLVFVLSSIFFPPIMIVTIGTVCKLHQKVESKIWKAAYQMPLS